MDSDVRRSVTTLLEAPVWVVLATGAAGDVSTRHFRREHTFQELGRLGFTLAERAATLLDQRRVLHLGTQTVCQRVVCPRAKSGGLSVDVDSARSELVRQRTALLRAGDVRKARTYEAALQGLALGGPTDAAEAELSAARLGELTLAAIDAGVRHCAHLFNAMPPLEHRAPGAAGALLSDARPSVEIIADGVHVHPAMLQLAVAARGAARVAGVAQKGRRSPGADADFVALDEHSTVQQTWIGGWCAFAAESRGGVGACPRKALF